MNITLDEIRRNIFFTFRKTALLLFITIFVYLPVVYFLRGDFKGFLYYLILTMLITLLIILLIYFSPRVKFKIEDSIDILAYTFLIGIILITLNSYPNNVIIYSFIFVGLIPAVLVHRKWPYIIYNGCVLFTYFATVFRGSSSLNTASLGLIKIEMLGVEVRSTLFVILLLGIAITYFVRKSIIEIFLILSTSMNEASELSSQLQMLNNELEKKVTQRTNQLKVLNDELRISKNAAESANKAKSDFLANMSHEIRTPINAISGLAYLLQKTKLSEKQKEYVAKTLSSSKALTAIVNDILDYSKIEANKVALENIEFDLFEVINNVADIISLKVYEKKLVLSLYIHPNIPQVLVGDPNKLSQILLNLVNNAVKFTEKGTVTISVNLLSQYESRVTLQFCVIDTGIGINQRHQASLFDSFEQGDMSTTRKYGGTGLGLAISKGLVELMGGSITFESSLGEGSTFSFSVELGNSSRKLIVEKFPSQMEKRTVLLISDNEDLCKVFVEEIELLGLEAKAMPSEENEIIKTIEQGRHDLLFIDWELKRKSGVEFIHSLREKLGCQIATVLLISTLRQNELEANVGHAGITKIIYYPISQSQLYNLFVEHFGSQLNQRPDSKYHQNIDFLSLRNTSVLLVEDHEINQLVAVDILEDAGIKVDIAANGVEAVEMVKRKSYDAILMDIQMPVMDGFEATRIIRELEGSKTLPIIAMTAEAIVGVGEQVIMGGMNAYITKPFDPIQLLKTLKKQISRKVKIGINPQVSNTSLLISLPQELPGLNIEEGQKKIKGNPEKYIRMLKIFKDEYLSSVKQINDLIIKNDLPAALEFLQTLKEITANIGANEVSQSVESIQTILEHKENQPEIRLMLEILDTKLNLTVNSINTILNEN